jgi:hypothetical protein
MPSEIFSWEQLFTLRGFIFFVVGGFMVGFGTRYAGGCTSGHAIMGLSSTAMAELGGHHDVHGRRHRDDVVHPSLSTYPLTASSWRRSSNNTCCQGTNDLKATRELDAMCVNESELKHPWWHNLKYSAWGMLFGIVFVKAEIISWFRIQEMFRFESFHMYGVIGTAVVVGLISVQLIKRYQSEDGLWGNDPHPNKDVQQGPDLRRFDLRPGLGHHGSLSRSVVRPDGRGLSVIIVTFLSAWLGTYVYGLLREKLPH